MLTIADRGGERRFTVHGSDEGGLTGTFGPGDEPLVIAGAVGPAGEGAVELFNGQGDRIFAATVTAQGGGRLELADGAGGVVLSADSTTDMGIAVNLMNSSGTPVLYAGGRAQGGLLSLMNAHGDTVVTVGTADSGLGGALLLKNGGGRNVFHAGYDVDGDGLVTVWDDQGRTRRTIAPE